MLCIRCWFLISIKVPVTRIRWPHPPSPSRLLIGHSCPHPGLWLADVTVSWQPSDVCSQAPSLINRPEHFLINSVPVALQKSFQLSSNKLSHFTFHQQNKWYLLTEQCPEFWIKESDFIASPVINFTIRKFKLHFLTREMQQIMLAL